MDKIDMLLIRACKSKNPSQRLMSVARRFTYGIGDEQYLFVIYRLCYLVDEFTNNTSFKLIADIHPTSQIDYHGSKYDFNKVVLRSLANRIRYHSKPSDYPDEMIWQKRFRK